jgi:hypothetical protein
MSSVSPCDRWGNLNSWFGWIGECAWRDEPFTTTTNIPSTAIKVPAPIGSLQQMPFTRATDRRWDYFTNVLQSYLFSPSLPAAAGNFSYPANASRSGVEGDGSSSIHPLVYLGGVATFAAAAYGCKSLYHSWGASSDDVVPSGSEVPLMSPSDVTIDMLSSASNVLPASGASAQAAGVRPRRSSV